MTESGLYTNSRMNSDLGSASDDEFVSSASTASGEYDEHPAVSEGLQQAQTALPHRISEVRQTASAPANKACTPSDCSQGGKVSSEMRKRSLHLLDLPMDILKEIIKEVGGPMVDPLLCHVLTSFVAR